MPVYKFLSLSILLLFATVSCAKQPSPVLLFASDRAGNGDIFALDARGNLSNLTNTSDGDWSPKWSPDGKQIVFTSHRDGQSDVWLMNSDGSNPRNLSRNPAWDYSPSWSPDGKQIVFISERDGDAEVFIQAVDSPAAVQITFNEHQDKLPAWSPDGEKIALASIINGQEQIYLLDLQAQNAIFPLLPLELNGTNPVWRADGAEIAFVGWQDSRAIDIYTLNPAAKTVEKRYSNTAWIGSLNWSADGQWLLFTGRQNGNHNLMALNLENGQVTQLTNNPAWDDFPALYPGATFDTTRLEKGTAFLPPPIPPAGGRADVSPPAGGIKGGRNVTPSNQSALRQDDQFICGVNLADLANAYLIQDIHFSAIKGYVNWATIEATPGAYRWVDPDNVLHAAEGAGAKTLLRVHGTPGWARPPDTSQSHPPVNLDDFDRFMRQLARRYRGRVAAYEIWNEPNLNYEWGYRNPSPAEYTELLKTAYRAIKAEDPAALVVSAGPAPTGDGHPPEALGDLDFIEGMYRAGAKGTFDALGSHIYSSNLPPDFDSPTDITFNRVAKQRQIMLNYNDAATPIWITEMGWNLKTHWDLGEYHNQGVSELEQAQYIQRAYQKIQTNWPWVEAAFLFNLDFSLAPWYKADQQMRWYAVLNPDRTPRPAYTALMQLCR